MTTTVLNPILIDVPMPIETPRLTIRPVMPGDGEAMNAAKMETWDQLAQWMPWAAGERSTPEVDEAAVRQGYARFILREDIWLMGIEKETGAPVLWTGLHRFDWNLGRFEIGYYVRKSAQGRGFATEGANALTRYAFNALAARRVEIAHADGNDPSRRVIERLGFAKESVRVQGTMLPGDRVADLHWYVRFDANGLPPLDVRWGMQP